MVTVPSADRDVDAAAKDLQETGDLNRVIDEPINFS